MALGLRGLCRGLSTADEDGISTSGGGDDACRERIACAGVQTDAATNGGSGGGDGDRDGMCSGEDARGTLPSPVAICAEGENSAAGSSRKSLGAE